MPGLLVPRMLGRGRRIVASGFPAELKATIDADALTVRPRDPCGRLGDHELADQSVEEVGGHVRMRKDSGWR